MPDSDPGASLRTASPGLLETGPAAGVPSARTPAGSAEAVPPGWDDCDPADLTNPRLYINRELSWLEFNQRVLLQARDPRHPLLERVKFLAIVATNLDEFFMVRVATLLRKFRGGVEDVSPDGLSTEQQLVAIRNRVRRMQQDQATCWSRELRPLLAVQNIRFLEPDQHTPAIRSHLREYFIRNIHPVLTPLAFDPGHPFPFISNLSMNLAVVVQHNGRTRFARVKVPDVLPRFVPVPEPLSGQPGLTFAFLEDVIKHNLSALFHGAEVEGAYLFRIVRDTDMVIQEDEADDLLESVDRTLKQLRYGALSELRVEAAMPPRVLQILVENFEVEDAIVSRTSDRLGFGDWMSLTRIHQPQLKDTPFSPRVLWADEEPEAIFDQIRERDVLVHHPFDSFASVEAFLSAAVADPNVIAIKMTLYRIGANSPLVDLLIEAADRGKQVAVLVELKARFDERNNIAWAHRLEAAGVHVVYGLLNLKTHCKLCLVVRQEADAVQRYAHIGTGNYNRATAQVYTDVGLFTAGREIVDDVTEVFNYLTGYSSKRDYRQLLVAPLGLRSEFKALVAREARHALDGRPARIIIKNNAVADPDIVRSLYEAAQAGVEVDLIVRGVCCLRPGIPGISDRIRVRSIVGRFLEHSRIYAFENDGNPDVYLGSADLMERNLDRRVETLCPVRDPDLRRQLLEVVLGIYLKDTALAMELSTDGSYERSAQPERRPAVNSHEALLRWYTEASLSD